MPRAHVLSVNVGRPAPFRAGERTLISAFVKTPVTGPVAARGHNLEGDEQGDRVHHGGPDQAVYARAPSSPPPSATCACRSASCTPSAPAPTWRSPVRAFYKPTTASRSSIAPSTG
jgi:hypothetical protein